jgi:inhibitor of KinA sporulation pathway (predicted exonuclease)
MHTALEAFEVQFLRFFPNLQAMLQMAKDKDTDEKKLKERIAQIHKDIDLGKLDSFRGRQNDLEQSWKKLFGLKAPKAVEKPAVKPTPPAPAATSDDAVTVVSISDGKSFTTYLF